MRFGQCKKYVWENSNILDMKTLKIFNRFDLKFKTNYIAKNKKQKKKQALIYILHIFLFNKWISIDFVKTKI